MSRGAPVADQNKKHAVLLNSVEISTIVEALRALQRNYPTDCEDPLLTVEEIDTLAERINLTG